MIAVGSKLTGFCAGLFGRDHYGDCRVEAIGVDWVVVRNDDGTVDFGEDDDIQKWLMEHGTDEETE